MNTTLNGVSMEILNGGNGKRAAFKNKQTKMFVLVPSCWQMYRQIDPISLTSTETTDSVERNAT